MTKSEIITRCVERVREYGLESIFLYSGEERYTLEEILTNEMFPEMEMAYQQPVQFLEFDLRFYEVDCYFFAVKASELTHYNTSVKIHNDSGENAYVKNKLKNDRLLYNKLNNIFKIIFDDGWSIYNGRYDS